MNHCKTCKYWKKQEYSHNEIPGVRVCSRVPHYWDATKWADDGESTVLLPEYEHVTAFVQDASDYKATLLTLPEFGCTLHEPIDGETP